MAGCLLLTAAYLAIGVTQLAGQRGNLLLAGLLAAGGFGLGTQFSTLIGHVMGAVPARFASDISGVTSTVTQVGGVVRPRRFRRPVSRIGQPARPVPATPSPSQPWPSR